MIDQANLPRPLTTHVMALSEPSWAAMPPPSTSWVGECQTDQTHWPQDLWLFLNKQHMMQQFSKFHYRSQDKNRIQAHFWEIKEVELSPLEEGHFFLSSGIHLWNQTPKICSVFRPVATPVCIIEPQSTPTPYHIPSWFSRYSSPLCICRLYVIHLNPNSSQQSGRHEGLTRET